MMRYKLCQCGGVREDKRGGTCQRCGAGKQNKSKTTTERGYDGAWKRFSERMRAENPLCEMCMQDGIVTPATEVHHKVSIDEAPWLRMERSNLLCLCNGCHKRIHANVAAK